MHPSLRQQLFSVQRCSSNTGQVQNMSMLLEVTVLSSSCTHSQHSHSQPDCCGSTIPHCLSHHHHCSPPHPEHLHCWLQHQHHHHCHHHFPLQQHVRVSQHQESVRVHPRPGAY